ncbi:MAG: tetratricopeptide repeat protein [Okeania sp. SIO3B5]|uniref:trypsin-like peptidase domain-containing protein n=1 Tax=Okeania sp. SIO3B5 TaxID=2607811 RepID=UPI0014013A23|nr:trypsin-like peptidase domain-containing protein [Okeania sp. SIO3B5]NEO55595.1 tetratricopeptide repeat protein [Okeania sp. SIO3B5]
MKNIIKLTIILTTFTMVSYAKIPSLNNRLSQPKLPNFIARESGTPLNPFALQRLAKQTVIEIVIESTLVGGDRYIPIGSGVIIGKKDKTYYVLTANHISDIDDGRFAYIRSEKTGSGLEVLPLEFIKRYPKEDLAVVAFLSFTDYEVVEVGDANQLNNNSEVYVAGWPGNEKREGFQVTQAQVTNPRAGNEHNPNGETNLNYLPTVSGEGLHKGMSGGAVLNEAGQLVGIHVGLVKSGDGDGVSISTFLRDVPREVSRVLVRGTSVASSSRKRENEEVELRRQQQQIEEEQRKREEAEQRAQELEFERQRELQGAEQTAKREREAELQRQQQQIEEERRKREEAEQKAQELEREAELRRQQQQQLEEERRKREEAEQKAQELEAERQKQLQKAEQKAKREWEVELQRQQQQIEEERRKREEAEQKAQELEAERQRQLQEAEQKAKREREVERQRQQKLEEERRKREEAEQKAQELEAERETRKRENRTARNSGNSNTRKNRTTRNSGNAATSQSQNVEAYYNRATAYLRQGNYEKAIVEANKAIRLNPKSAEPYVFRGAIYVGQREYKKGIADVNQAIRLNPKSAHAYFVRGMAYKLNRNIEKAISDFEKAAEISKQKGDRLAYQLSLDQLKELGRN